MICYRQQLQPLGISRLRLNMVPRPKNRLFKKQNSLLYYYTSLKHPMNVLCAASSYILIFFKLFIRCKSKI